MKSSNFSGEVFFLEASGFSMWPFVRDGEKLIVRKTLIEDLEVGEIILYRAQGKLVCHRLVRKIKKDDEYLLYSRGDNSLSLPELVAKDKFLGKVAGILRKNGKAVGIAGRNRRFLSRIIVVIAPFIVKLIKPCYFKLRNYVKTHIPYRRPR